MSGINSHIFLINFKLVFLQFANRKYCISMEISVSQVDVLLWFINVSNNVRYLDFVACISWKYSANKWLQMVDAVWMFPRRAAYTPWGIWSRVSESFPWIVQGLPLISLTMSSLAFKKSANEESVNLLLVTKVVEEKNCSYICIDKHIFDMVSSCI